MPYRRRTIRRRRLLRRPRRYIRRSRLPRTLPKRTFKVHHFKRSVQLTDINAPAGVAPSFGAYTINLNQLPNTTEFSNLFDSYRINKAVFKFIPNHNSSEYGTTVPPIGNFFTVIDYNDATAPAALADMMEYSTCKIRQGSRIITRVFTPASLDVVSAGAGTASVNPKWKQWLSCTSLDVNHYGLKWALDWNGTATSVTYKVYMTLYFSCKSVK